MQKGTNFLFVLLLFVFLNFSKVILGGGAFKRITVTNTLEKENVEFRVTYKEDDKFYSSDIVEIKGASSVQFTLDMTKNIFLYELKLLNSPRTLGIDFFLYITVNNRTDGLKNPGELKICPSYISPFVKLTDAANAAANFVLVPPEKCRGVSKLLVRSGEARSIALSCIADSTI